MHKQLEFKLKEEESKNINHLDISIPRPNNNICLRIHRKPTQTDTTIHFTSNDAIPLQIIRNLKNKLMLKTHRQSHTNTNTKNEKNTHLHKSQTTYTHLFKYTKYTVYIEYSNVLYI